MTGPTAVVLCNGLNGLGAVRSLGSAGVQVTGVFANSKDSAWTSRYVSHRLQAPFDSSDASWNAVPARARPQRVVIPTSDVGVGLLSRLRPGLPEDVRVVAPPKSVGELLVDKRREVERIQTIGASVPRSVLHLPGTAGELLQQLSLPVILKPVLFEDSRIIGAKNLTARNPGELELAYARMQGRADRFIAQEIVPGDDSQLWVCNVTFDRNHRLVSAFSFQRLRTSPAHFGVTSSAVSRRNDEVIARVESIGRELGYVGPAMFEFKQHPGTDEYLYIEINPRIGMCNWFDTCCGVNNVLAAYRVASGEPLDSTLPAQRDGVVFLDLFADFYSRLADGEKLGAVVQDYREHLRSPRVAAYYLSRDPRPGIIALRRNFVNALRIGGGLLSRRFGRRKV